MDLSVSKLISSGKVAKNNTFCREWCLKLLDVDCRHFAQLSVEPFLTGDEEWKLAKQLHNSLKVHVFTLCSCCHLTCRYHATSRLITTPLLLSLLFSSHAVIGLEPQQILQDATHFFSRPMPNLAHVIPAMDHIEETLLSGSLDMSHDPAIRAALMIAWKTLNCYYGLTNSSEAYQIVMGELTGFWGVFKLNHFHYMY